MTIYIVLHFQHALSEDNDTPKGLHDTTFYFENQYMHIIAYFHQNFD